jgi:orotate phosphoribosyltransferase
MHRIVPSRPEFGEVLTALYDASFVPGTVQAHYRPDGKTDAWALDLRRGLSRHSLLAPVAREMGRLLTAAGVNQIVGKGYGSAFLLGGILASAPNLRAGIIRDVPKPHGFRNLLEGSVTNDRPVFLVDDVLSSGRSAAASLDILQQHGFTVAGLAVVFRYGWRKSEERLKEHQIPVHSLATLYPSL